MKTLTPMLTQAMAEIDLFEAQDLADRTGKTVYATALFDKSRKMLTIPQLTTDRPSHTHRTPTNQIHFAMVVTYPGQ